MTDDALEVPWEGDVNDTVVTEWKEDTTPFDRVRSVIDVTADPQYASEIAERARVSEPTARKYLSTFVESGLAESVPAENGTKYKRSRQSLAMQRITAIHREHSKQELLDAIGSLRDQITALQEEYDVTDPDDLAFELDASDHDWSTVATWRRLDENLDVAKAALSLYDFDPDDDGPARATGDDTAGTERRRSTGAFAESSVEA